MWPAYFVKDPSNSASDMITENNDVILDHSFKVLKVDINDQILTITLNRPERLNTFDEGMKEIFPLDRTTHLGEWRYSGNYREREG